MKIDPETYQAPEWDIPIVPTPVDDLPREQQKPGGRSLKAVWDLLETLILAAILFLGINAISARIRVDGTSMEPSLANGEFLIVNKLAYKLSSPAHGDVVVFRFPRNPDQEYIKRIIGLPGDTVHISDGTVYVNEQEINEPYIAASPSYAGTWIVPDESIFVLGDNRNNSSDSHSWGTVPYENLVGKAQIILFSWKPGSSLWNPVSWFNVRLDRFFNVLH